LRELEVLGRHRQAERPERLELVRRELAEAVEIGAVRKRSDDDQRELRRRGIEQRRLRERLEQLKRVVEIGPEPEHDVPSVPECPLEHPVTLLEDVGDGTRTAPAAATEEARTDEAQLARGAGDDRTLGEDVLPGEHRAAERRLAERVAAALAVRHV